MKSRSKACELCRGEAFLYCDSDSAFLCWNCDARVHGANFLVARHVRRTICCICQDFDGKCFSGVGFSGPCRIQNDGFAAPCRRICRSCVSCVSDSGQVSSDSSGLTSVSVAPVTKKKKTIEKNGIKKKIGGVRSVSDISGQKLSEERKRAVLQSAEGILVNWCRKLGLNGNSETVSLALNAFSVYLRELTLLPFRVALASCFWVSLEKGSEGNLGSGSTCRDIKRFANVCGVPVKLISMAEKKIVRLLKAVDRDEKTDLEEGWAECSQ